ncbi:MAG: cellulase family glycosylhydrolase [Gallionellaceae bacterium]|nr:cellulase family glycosylhydrolase [Gallionellaceae bacterium]
MKIFRWFIVLMACCVLVGPAFSAVMPTLSAADFLKQTYRGFTLDRASSKSATDFDDLAAMGVNLVRLGISLERCEQCLAYSIVPGNLEEVDRVVALAAERGIYVILTMEPEAPERAAYWESASLQASIIKIWAGLAERYKQQPAMGGFDLINEPSPPGDWREASRRYVDFASRIIGAIRQKDPQRMIVYEPAPRGNAYYGFKALERPLPYNNVLYSPHFYMPIEITHQGIKGESFGESYPTSEWNKVSLSAQLEPMREFVRKYRLPVYVGEFSCVRNAPGGTAYLWIKDVAELFEAEGWSWTFHAFRGYHLWDMELQAWSPKPASVAEAASMRSISTPVMVLLRSYLKKNLPPFQ